MKTPNYFLDPAKLKAAKELWNEMELFYASRGIPETVTSIMRTSFEEFLEILHDFTLDEIIDARAFVTADDWERCEALMSTEGGKNGYYWTRTRTQQKGLS